MTELSPETKKIIELKGDNYYIKGVVPKIKDSDLDKLISGLPNQIGDNTKEILIVHKKLSDIFKMISGLSKISLASKYLHFHRENLFYIYDSRSNECTKKLIPDEKDIDLPSYDPQKIDITYAKFYHRCIKISDSIFKDHNLTPRKLDKVLLSL